MRRGGIRRAIGAMVAGTALLGAIAASVIAPAAASAQTTGDIPYLDAVDAWADGQALRRTLPGSGGGTGTTEPSKRTRRAKKPTTRQLAMLRFERSDEVTSRNYQAVMDLLTPGFDPVALTAEFDRLRALAHQEMREAKGGWSPDDLGDVAAYILLVSYSAFHSQTSLPDSGMAAVRRTARNDLARDKQVRRLSDARKQEAAEMLELRTILRVSDLNWGRIEGDVARQDAARAELRSWMKAAFGVDLERVKLTRRGLVVRER